MKRLLRAFKSAPKRVITSAGLIVAAAVLSVSSTLNAASVRLEGSLGIANVTRGDTRYSESVGASYDEVLKVQVYYHNMEDPNSNKVANNLRLKLNVPTAAGQRQVISGTLSSPDSNTVTDSVVANLDRADARIEYIPGSAVWKHNKGTNQNVQIVEEKISDEVVYGGVGLVLENAKPCFNFDATVTILVRVKVPGIKIDKRVRVKGATEWTTMNTAKPDETVEYIITYQNAGNTTHRNVLIRDNMPAGVTYVPGSTKLINSSGNRTVADGVTTTGIVVGNYLPGSGAHVMFEAKMPSKDKLECGKNTFRNVGVARPEGMFEYYNTAITEVEKKCEEPHKPVYSCDLLTVEKLGGRKVRATVKVSSDNTVSFKAVEFNYGDGSTPKVTNSLSDEYTYQADGTYTISAKVTFSVNGQDKVATSEACVKKVAFVPADKCPIPGKEHLPKNSPDCKEDVVPVTPVTPSLPKTGAAGVAGIVAIVSVLAGAVHNVLSRRFMS